MADKNQQITQKIEEHNRDLRERIAAEKWNISYDKRTDMVFMGATFLKGTFYVPINDTGFLVRVDKDYKIHGFAIENAKHFIKENPDMRALNLIVRPFTTISLLLMLLTTEWTLRGLSQLRDSILKPILPDYLSRKACV